MTRCTVNLFILLKVRVIYVLITNMNVKTITRHDHLRQTAINMEKF